MSIILTASGALPSLTNGAADIAQSETSTNKQNDAWIDFSPGVQSFVEWSSVAPSVQTDNRAAFNVYWTTTSASTNSVVWGLQVRAFASGDPVDSPYGTALEVTSANQGANLENVSSVTNWPTNTILIGNWSRALTPYGTGRSFDQYTQRLKFRLYRLGSGADTLAATARVSLVRFFTGMEWPASY